MGSNEDSAAGAARVRVEVSAPGKTILMGEHAAVYGRPALVTAVDRRAWAELELRLTEADSARVLPPDARQPGAGLLLDLPDVGVREWASWRHLVGYGDARRRAWHDLEAGTGDFAAMRGTDPAHVVKTALGETARWVADQGLGDVEDLGVGRLRITSDIPVGAGFGSSAAVSVAVIRALAEVFGFGDDSERLQALSLEVERRQHGTPSGVDSATVIRGGIQWVERRGTALHVESLDGLSSGPSAGGSSTGGPFRDFHIFDSGAPGESTGEVVAAVRNLRQRSPVDFDRRLDQASEQTEALRRQLESPTPSPDVILDCVRRFGGWLEGLGAVPPAVREAFRGIEASGGAAKISGAGSLAGPGAGSVLIYHRRPEALGAEVVSRQWQPIETTLAAEGVRVEASESTAQAANPRPLRPNL